MSQRPFAACSLVLFNPLDGTHQTLASVGYDERVLSHLNGRFLTDDVAYNFYRAHGHRQRALKWAEMPFTYKDTYSVQEIFQPAGFKEGITLCLYSRDGRYTGSLHISTDDARFPTEDMMSGDIQCLQTILGNFTDLLRSVAGPLAAKFENGGGCLITTTGEVLELPGVSPLFQSLRIALCFELNLRINCQIPDVFLFKHGSVWYRVHTGIVNGGARAIVAERCVIPHELTGRELEIIEMLISGATNLEIASQIFVARTTVAKHLENIFDKLECNSRTSVVTTALTSNLRRLPRLRGDKILQADSH